MITLYMSFQKIFQDTVIYEVTITLLLYQLKRMVNPTLDSSAS